MSLNDILEKVQAYSPDAELDVIMDAYVYSAQAHRGQTRKSGEDYLIHPLAVSEILTDLRMDVDTIATGLLHDTMEDCLTTYETLESLFGEDVANIVDGVTKIGKLQFRSKHEAQAENFRKLVLAMSKDVRVILVKLADRLHNMRTMEHMKPDARVRISRETMDIYAPIANRLGLSRIKSELEDHSFRYLHPDIYSDLTTRLEAQSPDHDAYIQQTLTVIKEILAEGDLDCDVSGRTKHIVSTYRKMETQNLDFEQVHDLLAFRVVVDNLGQCYTALGLIHAMFPHVPSQLKDYIAQPKSNGYQSLHTVIMGPDTQQIELQIRTRAMHRVAEVGIAAHWRYKEGHLALSREDISKIARLRNLFDAANDVTDPTEFLETVKIDLFSNEIFVFTPQGHVKFFPNGATPIDFAYAIHTEVGQQCTSAKVNGRIVPLRYTLQNGDRIEIMTSPNQTPNRDWLDIAQTGRALSKIRRFILEEERTKGREMGRTLLETELKKYGYTLNKLVRSGKMDEVAKHFGHHRPDQVYLDIANGNTSINKVLAEIVPPEDLTETETSNPLTNLMNRLRKRAVSPVLIDGEEGLLTTYGKCCNPLPGEAVVGFITRGHGITVHKAACAQLLSSDPDRRVNVQWHSAAATRHTTEIEMVCLDRPGMLAELGAICKGNNINITQISSKGLQDNKACISMEVLVGNVDELQNLLRNLEKIKGVIRVVRRCA